MVMHVIFMLIYASVKVGTIPMFTCGLLVETFALVKLEKATSSF